MFAPTKFTCASLPNDTTILTFQESCLKELSLQRAKKTRTKEWMVSLFSAAHDY